MLDSADPSYQHLDELAQRAALRDRVLQCGRLLGWRARTVIVFTEQLAGRPWKRCTRAELTGVLDELRAILRAFEVRKDTPPVVPLGRAAAVGGGRRAPRA